MREIKFRGWRGETQKYYYYPEWSTLEMFETLVFSKYTTGYIDESDFNNEIILEQYTGLKDKNGKEIYEGDILSFEYGVGFVLYEYGCFKIEFDTGNDLLWLYCCKDSETEIMGNINENEDLIRW